MFENCKGYEKSNLSDLLFNIGDAWNHFKPFSKMFATLSPDEKEKFIHVIHAPENQETFGPLLKILHVFAPIMEMVLKPDEIELPSEDDLNKMVTALAYAFEEVAEVKGGDDGNAG